MMTVLEVIRHKKSFVSVLCPYKISCHVKSQDNISFLHIRYHLYRGRVNFKKLYALTLGYPQTILCESTVSLQNSPFTRFRSDSFKIRMMQNFVLSVVGKLSFSPKICYVDKTGDFPDFIRQCSADITVITDMPRFYENISHDMADVFVSNSFDDMGHPHIILSVSPPETLPENDALIFTCQPCHFQNTPFSEYRLPSVFSEIQPDCLSREYFLSGLYEIGGAEFLQNIIPTACSDGVKFYSADYMAALLETRR